MHTLVISTLKRLPAIGVAGALVLAQFLGGCRGIPTRAEKAARNQLHNVSADYRPQGNKPTLPVLTPDSTLSNFLAYAMLNHPAIEQAYYDWAASVERLTQARSLPDPQFTFQMDIQNVVTSVMPGLMGAIPWPDKLRLGAEIASAESEAKYFTFESRILQQAFEVKRTYYQLHFLNEKIHVTTETLRLLSELEQLARAQNEVGKATLQDVLRAQIEQDRLRSEIANLEDSRSSLVAQFQAALGINAGAATVPMPGRFEFTSPDLDPDKLLETALSRNQRLKAMTAEVRAAEASLLLARKGRLPDFSLGFMADLQMNPTLYRLPGGPGTVSLPIWRDKIAAQIAEAQANKRSTQARLSVEELNLAVDIAARSFLYREANRNLALIRDQLLPKATQAVEAARSGYLSGQIDFLNLTDAQRTLLSLRLDQVEARTAREIVLAELSLIVAGMSPANEAMPQRATAMGGRAASATSGRMKGGM